MVYSGCDILVTYLYGRNGLVEWPNETYREAVKRLWSFKRFYVTSILNMANDSFE